MFIITDETDSNRIPKGHCQVLRKLLLCKLLKVRREIVLLFVYPPYYPTPSIPKQRLKTHCCTYKWLHLINVTLKARLLFFTGDSCTPILPWLVQFPLEHGSAAGVCLCSQCPFQQGRLAFIHTQLLGINYVTRESKNLQESNRLSENTHQTLKCFPFQG